MDHVRLGTTDLTVSRIILGCMSYGDPTRGSHGWVLTEEASQPFFRAAIEAGITAFDTANVYSIGASEEVTGRAIRQYSRREDVVLATKLGLPMGDGPLDRGLSREAVHAQLDASLRRLGTDYVDLYQIHRFDPHTPIEETMAALDEVVKAGKARHIGASSMFAWQFATMQEAAERAGGTRFSTMQDQYNLLQREEEREMHPYCVATGVGVIPWSPLARGRLTRPYGESTARAELDQVGQRYYRQAEDADRAIVDAAGAIAEDRGVSRAQVALAWQFAKPAVTAPIVGATKPQHLTDALAAVELRLTDDEVARLEAPYTPRHPEF
jgi:Predicted oxidoreductases (related to aryl-alcohol dehydrogenases)